MDKRGFLLLICLCGSPFGQAQISSSLPVWAGRYEAVRPSENVFIVTKDRKMGVVSRLGKPLTQLAYDTIFDFHEGMAIVGRGHRVVNQFGKVSSDFKYGYLTKAGRLAVPTKYDHIEDFSEGLGLIDESRPYQGGKFVYYDRQGKVRLWVRHVYTSSSFRGNMAYAEVPHQGFWLPPYTGPGYPVWKQEVDVNGNFIYGNYLDHAGRLLVPWKYDTIAPYQPGYLRPVRKNGKWGFLDALARVAVLLQYDDIDADSAYFWQTRRRVSLAGRFGFMNPRTGQLVVPLHYEATLPSQRPVLWVRQQGRWGVIDARLKTIIPARYDEATPFDTQGLSVVKKGDVHGLVNDRGRELTLIQYERILPFQEARAVVERAGRFGFLTTDGHEVVPAVYEEVSQFTGGRAFAKRWGLFVTLDPDGNWIGWKLQTPTLQWIVTMLVLLTGLVWWVRHRQKLKVIHPDG